MAHPVFGAVPQPPGVHFRLAAGMRPGDATRAAEPALVIESGAAAGTYELTLAADDLYEVVVPGAAAGDRYRYRIGGQLRPDPASRFQPGGVHGPSEIVDPAHYRWRDSENGWRGRAAGELVIYELHIGTFTREGTFDAARRQLPYLRDLGITAVELMPVADFAGARNWGYDGVDLFAPSRVYGRPDDLRAFVDDAHALGLAVILDVVYNHLGPEGAYMTEFLPAYVTTRHVTPWGGAINLDGCGSATVRRLILDNAVHWVREYHLDGLRLDATHALIDDSVPHLLADLGDAVRGAVPWPVVIHAEDHRNLASIVEPREAGGWGLDAIWADDFHHIIRRMLAGDSHSYYADYAGTVEELAQTIRQGWLYTGQPSKRTGRRRGTDASRVAMQRAIVCLQNHDQVGNRASGDRLHHQIDAAAWRAASTLLLTVPMTPLLFMGQEWAASTPFQFFTDLEPGLGQAVTEGRRREFGGFAEAGAGAVVPDPQALATFHASVLRWEEQERTPHASALALYTELLRLRQAHPALHASASSTGEAWTSTDDGLVMRRSTGSDMFLIVVTLEGKADVEYAPYAASAGPLEVALTTEDPPFAPDAQPVTVGASSITFQRAGAVILRAAAHR